MSSADFEHFFTHFATRLLTEAPPVDTGHWQAIKDVPQTKTFELRNEVMCMGIPATVGELQDHVAPNLPWAEDHFLERVGGEPLNPGVQYKNWPWYRGNVPAHQTMAPEEVICECGMRFSEVKGLKGFEKHAEDLDHVARNVSHFQFSHTYMERYWPKRAWHKEHYGPENRGTLQGIRYPYGDLNDLVDLLVREPYTRQAYLPVWFPEDTGATDHQRVPCSLGYHFLFRGESLHVNYYIRSCDLLRHFRDDVYLTGRLCQWVLDQARNHRDVEESMLNAVPGELTMVMSSLHVFEGDLPKLRREYA